MFLQILFVEGVKHFFPKYSKIIEYLNTGYTVIIKNLSEARRHSKSAPIVTKLAGGVEGDLLRVCKLLS